MDSDQQDNLIAGLSIASGTCSIVAILFGLFCYFKYKKLQVIEFKTIIYMLIGDLFFTLDIVIISIWYFFVPAADTVDCPNVCLLMGFVKVFGGLISFIWTFNISYILKTCLFDPSFSLQKIWAKLQLISLFVSLTLSLIPYAFNAYGQVIPQLRGTNCFILYGAHQYKNNSIQIICFYGPLWFIWGYCLYAKLRVLPSTHIKIEKRLKEIFQDPQDHNLFEHLKLYPLVSIFCNIWISIYAVLIMAGVNPSHINRLEVVIYFFQNMNGLLNCTVYVYFSVIMSNQRLIQPSPPNSDSENIEQLLLDEQEQAYLEPIFPESDPVIPNPITTDDLYKGPTEFTSERIEQIYENAKAK